MKIDDIIILQEQNILYCCLKKPEYIYDINKKYFVTEEGRSIYTAIKNLVIEERNINTRNILVELGKIGSNINLEIIKELFNIENISIEKKDFDSYYQNLKELWVRFDIQNNILQESLKELSSRDKYIDLDKIKKLNNEITSRLNEVESKERKRIYSSIEMLDEYENVLNKRLSGIDLYSTGDDYLDDKLSEKFAPQYISIIFGHSGVGKSSYALHLVRLQLNKMIPSVYITLEMSYDSTMDRLISSMINIPYYYFHFNSSDLLEENSMLLNILQKVKQMREYMREQKYFKLVDYDNMNLNDLEKIIVEIKQEMGVDYLVVTIDLLTMITDFNSVGVKKADAYEDAMNRLHTLARKHNVHFVGIVQGRMYSNHYNIEEEDQLNQFRPQAQEIKNSKAIYERSRIILGVFRPKYFANLYMDRDNPQLELIDDIAEISILKQNNGEISTIKYLYQPECFRFIKYVEENTVDDSKE